MTDALASDVIPALAIVAPGFLVLCLIASFRGRRLSGNALFVTLGSILISGVLVLFFLAWNGLRDGPSIVAFVFAHPLLTALQFLALAVATSLAAAFLEDHDPLRWAFRKVVKRTRGRAVQSLSVWDAHLQESLDHPVLVEAHDGRLIGGFLRRHSLQGEDEAAALVLVKPALVQRRADGELSGVQLGAAMLLQAGDIRSVTTLDGPLVDQAPRE